MSTTGPYRPRLVSVKAACYRTGLNRTHMMALLARGEIATIKLGDRRLVVLVSLEAFVARQRVRAERDGRVRRPPVETDLNLPSFANGQCFGSRGTAAPRDPPQRTHNVAPNPLFENESARTGASQPSAHPWR